MFELEGAQFTVLAIDPNDSEVAYVGSGGKVWETGLYTSRDGGQNWSRINSTPVSEIIVDPLDPATVYAAMRDNVVRFTFTGAATAVQSMSWGSIKALRSGSDDPPK